VKLWRIDAKTDDSAKENVPKEEDALSNPNSKQEKNESNQEKTIMSTYIILITYNLNRRELRSTM
jgi:hypothetical protein